MSGNRKMSPMPSLSSFSGLSSLSSKIFFVLFALLVFRVGSFIPVPGVNPQIILEIFERNSSGVLGLFNILSGGALKRVAIFSLSVFPYISASIIFQLVALTVPYVAELKKEGIRGREKINEYVRYLTVFIALLQSFVLALSLERIVSYNGYSAVSNPGLFFIITAMITFTAGTMFLLWLGERITEKGIGNGVSLIIFAGIVTQLPGSILSLFSLGRTGAISFLMVFLVILISIFLVAFVVLMERSFRPVIVFYPKQQRGMRMSREQTSYLPLRINSAGVIPAIFAASLLLLPIAIIQLYVTPDSPDWLITLAAILRRGSFLYLFFYSLGIVFFAFFYTAVTFDPNDVAENLRKQGGYIHGIRPGSKTAEYLDYVLTRLTVLGALYLVFICVLPEILVGTFNFPLYLGGTSLLIVVSVVIDTLGQIQGYLYMHQYKKFMKKSNILGRK